MDWEVCVETAAYSLSPFPDCVPGVPPQAAARIPRQISVPKIRMLTTSPRIHRRARAGSLGRHGDANRLVLRHVALDPDKCPVVVEDQRVAREPQGVET